MVSSSILTSSTGDNHDDPTRHIYGTRTRKNPTIKPSIRTNRLPDSYTTQRKPKLFSNIRARPGPAVQAQGFPRFPPANVMLHTEDVNNKVLMAIGRAFLSVDNRAMTIKDLADMCMGFGLMCQSASAAGQAITSFIRSHLTRCEFEQDQPLLLKHVLTGTSSDDELVPALHSRSGGAHCTLAGAEHRLTNFRRGTMIWYLSKAAGAPCPFARAGIRLCDHKDTGEQKHEQHCGQKRKRFLRARSRGVDSDSEGVNSDVEMRLPKVKLTLRLKPPRMLSITSPSTAASSSPSSAHSRQRSKSLIDLSKESDSDSMSVDISEDDDQQNTAKQEESVFPPYPRQSISIPAYTPSVEDLYPELFTPASSIPTYHRSPSVARSIASPPPDSEDEDDNFSGGIATRRRHSSALARPSPSQSDIDADFGDVEDDFDDATRYESPAPRSPWTPSGEDGVVVKEEPTDVGGILEAWERIDSIMPTKNILTSVQLPLDAEVGIKFEEPAFWDWDRFDRATSKGCADEKPDAVVIKQEEVDNAIILSDEGIVHGGHSMAETLSAVEPSVLDDICALQRHNEVIWHDVELLGPDSVHVQDFEEGNWIQPCNSAPVPLKPSRFTSSMASPQTNQNQLESTNESESTTSESDLGLTATETSDPTVVHTIRHFSPAICVVQVDGIPIYQLIIDSYPLLRRFDTDFVNLSRIVDYLRLSSSSMDGVLFGKEVLGGCPLIRGKWVPLDRAREFVGEYARTHPVLATFLSGDLHKQFPSCVMASHLSSQETRLSNQFGQPFRSMVHDARPRMSIDDLFEASTPWERGSWEDDDHFISIHPSLGIKSADIPVPTFEEQTVPETALSPIEQEIFQSLCGSPDWDVPVPATSPTTAEIEKEVEGDDPVKEETPACMGRTRNLRRSKRVADIVSKSRTRTGRSRV